MKLRKLNLDDAPRMLEWMHDDNVVHDLQTDFSSKTMDDCERFIGWSLTAPDDINLAISNEADEYMGTVSLKHIDRKACTAEFAITVRKEAMGKGFAEFGMTEIIRYAFNELALNAIYWCVSKNNTRAVRFYEKHQYRKCDTVPAEILKRYEFIPDLLWFCKTKTI